MDILADALHKLAVVFAFEGSVEGEVALDEDIDGQYQKQHQHQHNPTAVDGHIPEGYTLGRGGSHSVLESVDSCSGICLNH